MTGNSIERCVRELVAADIETEVLCVMDGADAFTRSVVEDMIGAMGDRWKGVDSEARDLGTARNKGISLARHDHVCIADGDDYYSKNWPLVAYRESLVRDAETAFHPEFMVNFGAKEDFTQQFGQSDPLYDEDGLLTVNFWQSCVLTRTSIFMAIPYRRNAGTGFGYEDWHWNCETVARGVIHDVAKDTAIFYRRKNDGLLAKESSAGSLVGPNALFSPARIQCR